MFCFKSQSSKRPRHSEHLKLLLLGGGDSGKSTIYKQIKNLYGNGYSLATLKEKRELILSNVKIGIILLLEGLVELGISLERGELMHRFENFTEDTILNPLLAEDIKLLWNDAGIQEVWENKDKIHFPYDNFEYYLDSKNLDRIALENDKYIPCFDDWVRCRITTTGVSTLRFKLYSQPFELVDVGGQRGERKKWLSCFTDNVVAILFTVGMSSYDQDLFEDNTTNCIDESVQVWKEIVNNDMFNGQGFILFLNKYDLFMNKVSKKLYRDDAAGINTDYKGKEPSLVHTEHEKEEAQKECAEHLKLRFIDVVLPRLNNGTFSCHYTTAVNSDATDHVFERCQEQILARHLL